MSVRAATCLMSLLLTVAFVAPLPLQAAKPGPSKGAATSSASSAAQLLDPGTATPGIPAANLKGLELVQEGEGKEVFLSRCTACHALTDVVSKRKTRPQWEQRIREMIDLGAKVPPDDVKTITNYLATHYGL